MKKLNLYHLFVVILIVFNTTSNLFSQIDSLTTQPLFPNNTEETQLICHMNLSSKPCYLDSFSIEFKNDTIHAKLFYTTGSMSSICERVDTLNLGVLDLGSYTIKAEKYYLHISDSIVYNTIYLDVNVGYLSIGHIITNSINLYPNPTNKSLNININGIDDLHEIQIHDVSGRLISTLNISENTKNHIVLDISTLTNGVYICTLQGSKNHISKKFIKY